MLWTVVMMLVPSWEAVLSLLYLLWCRAQNNAEPKANNTVVVPVKKTSVPANVTSSGGYFVLGIIADSILRVGKTSQGHYGLPLSKRECFCAAANVITDMKFVNILTVSAQSVDEAFAERPGNNTPVSEKKVRIAHSLDWS